jgi:flagellar biosynthesis/type III secretory pathway protein FliH
MTIKTEYIDVTPTWETAAATLAHVMQEGTAEGQKLARAELIRMGQLVDNLQAELKTMKGAS